MHLKRLKIIFFLLIIVIICFIGIIFLTGERNVEIEDQIFENAIRGTMWPSGDIPLISKEGLKVEDFGEYTCQASIASGVTYEEFREYLIELYEIGFKPVSEFGSQNPKRLVNSIEDTDITELTWIAEMGNYSVTVLWAKEGAVNEFDIPYEYNFDMNLFIKPGKSILIESDEKN